MAGPGGTFPFRQFVLKIHSRCDLACDHCYVYEHADQSWRGRPTVISAETVAKAGERIAEHARDHRLPEVRVILHGGEPLLAGAVRLAAIARGLRRAIEPVCRVDLRIHTNGVQLDVELCELFLAERVRVGISLDGDRAANDLHRRYANGRSSYDQVLRAVALLRKERYRGIYAGLLATIDIRSDPVAVYRALAALEPPNLDFLLPHGTWDSPPPGAAEPGATHYADWLIAVFGEWARDGRRVPIRMFESIIETSYGGVSATESLGLAPSDVVVIEADGTIEQADSLKVAYDGAPATGLDIFRHPLDAAAAHPAIKARQRGIDGLSATCRGCPVVTSCGGGLYAHRYRAGSGFANPSVYCGDLEKIIAHVRAQEAARRPPGHSLPQAHFDALAAGYGDAASVSYLSAAQRSVRRLLLRMLRERVTGDADGTFAGGWNLLTRLDKSAPAVVDEVLAHPYVRAWAERCLRTQGPMPPADASHLASIAAAAAIRSGTLAELDVPVTGGYAHLPTLGRLRLSDTVTATLAVRDAGAFEVRAASCKWFIERGVAAVSQGDDPPDSPEPEPAWQPVRELRAGKFTVRLEDTDPYRDCHQWPVAGRLTADEAAAWQAQFEEAWQLIERAYPRYAPGVAAGLSVLLPLANDVPGREISAAARQAFGAIAVALPASGADLALLIIHEFQHVKLGALTDMFDLCDRTDQRVYFAPWREDPRPLGALLQGTYAHIAVTDYWRLRRQHRSGPDALAAAEQFARWRMMTAEAIETLAGSDALTPLGAHFVDCMRATARPWLGEQVPEAATAAAGRWAAERRDAWHRQRNALGATMRDCLEEACPKVGHLTRERLVSDLRALGVGEGRTLLVHTSLRSIGHVEGGAATVVAALREAVGRTGTIVVPTFTEENSLTSRAHLALIAKMTPLEVREFRDRMPAFDPANTPATRVGIISETLRTTPGAIRSHHPQNSFAAIGAEAAELMTGHLISCHLGEHSPLAKLYKRDALILLLGVGYEACSALHLAEYRYTPRPPRRTYACVVNASGRRQWITYQDVVLDDTDFPRIGEMIGDAAVTEQPPIGKARSRLIPLRETVDFAVEWMARNRS